MRHVLTSRPRRGLRAAVMGVAALSATFLALLPLQADARGFGGGGFHGGFGGGFGGGGFHGDMMGPRMNMAPHFNAPAFRPPPPDFGHAGMPGGPGHMPPPPPPGGPGHMPPPGPGYGPHPVPPPPGPAYGPHPYYGPHPFPPPPPGLHPYPPPFPLPVGAGFYPGAWWVGTAAATALAMGSAVYQLPPTCSQVIVGNVSYQQCGPNWFKPQFNGGQVIYRVVPGPY
ncbi:hypothetical protein ACT6QH_13495 [Xanthobacter sp. TB0139]|uniref:hypothetical protein n=1 Tax=Xanthobacter sp. TB0139 TaxID=3459178 RepID=UPI004039D7FE